MSEVQVRVGRRLDVAALRLVATVQPALLLLQAAFAGQFLGGNQSAVGLHGTNAALIQLLGLVQVALAVVVWRRRGPAWPAAVSALLLVAIEVQFVMGFRQRVSVHVPLGVAIFGAMLWLAIALGRFQRSHANRRDSGTEPDNLPRGVQAKDLRAPALGGIRPKDPMGGPSGGSYLGLPPELEPRAGW